MRYPAALNGVFGFKPSYGTLSRHGLVPLANALDTPSVFARSAPECKHYYGWGGMCMQSSAVQNDDDVFNFRQFYRHPPGP